MPLTRSVAMQKQSLGFKTMPRKFCSHGMGAALPFHGMRNRNGERVDWGSSTPFAIVILEKEILGNLDDHFY